MEFIKVTKANHKRDRGIIAVDAICSVFENQEDKTTTIMTMDGYWYEVLDDIEKLWANIENSKIEVATEETFVERKGEYCRKHRMPAPAVSEKGGDIDREKEKPTTSPIIKEERTREEQKKFTRKPYVRGRKPKKRSGVKDLSSGDDKEYHKPSEVVWEVGLTPTPDDSLKGL